MTQLCLIRHGQTDWNLEGRYQGQSDVDLNQTGVEQAWALSRKLENKQFLAFYASDLKRARHTAEIVSAPHALEVQLDRRLREINQGEWEGLLASTIQERYESLWNQRAIDPSGIHPPGGETVEEVAHRVYAALDEISTRYPVGLVGVVSHGLSIATILCKVNGIPVKHAYRSIPDNAEPVWVEWVKEGL